MAFGDAPTNTTTLDKAIPSLIESRIFDAVNRQALWENIIGEENVVNLGGVGDTFDINQISTATMAATTQTAQQTETAVTPTSRQFVPATYGVTYLLSWEGKTYSQLDAEAMIARVTAAAYLTLLEGTATAAAGVNFNSWYGEAPTSGPDHFIGTDGTPLNSNSILQAQQLLLTALAPMDHRYVIDPIQYRELMQDTACKADMQNTRGAGLAQVATMGVQPNRYLGDIHGVPVFVANAMAESSGLHSLMFAKGAIGVGYKMISTPLSPVPSRINTDISWGDGTRFAWTITVRTVFDVVGQVFTSTTNKWVVDIIS